MPILDVLRKYPREVLLAMGMRVAENGTFYILTVYVLVYGNEELKLPKSTMLWGVVIAALLGLVTIPWYGRCRTGSAGGRCTCQSDIYADDHRERELASGRVNPEARG